MEDWKMPEWMIPYKDLICHCSIDVEKLLTEDTSDSSKELLACEVRSRTEMLSLLYNLGLLKDADSRK